ncbi:MAG: isoprenylcysteine carboxylmethyltransferase family protein [Gemmatimonadota bacterium]|nr:isoprenylcysteine carboxylmethyltransferase family protein [Gemmatimonadota bacterium]
MHWLGSAWLHGLIAVAVIVWAFWPEMQIIRRSSARQRSAATPRDPSFRWMLLMQNAGVGGALVAAVFLPQFGLRDARETLFWSGIALIIAGSLLRRHCWRMLGSDFTGDVEVRAEQRVVERGAYRWVRHPSYTAGLMMMAGIGLVLSNWLSLLLIVLSSAAGYAYRVHVEEAALVETLGDSYRSYMDRTRRFIPYLV